MWLYVWGLINNLVALLIDLIIQLMLEGLWNPV